MIVVVFLDDNVVFEEGFLEFCLKLCWVVDLFDGMVNFYNGVLYFFVFIMYEGVMWFDVGVVNYVLVD